MVRGFISKASLLTAEDVENPLRAAMNIWKAAEKCSA